MPRIALWTALLVAATVTAAGAALWSPPLSGGYGTRLSCRVMNISSSTKYVTIQIVSGQAAEVLANTALQVQPGHSISATTAGTGTGYCWVGGIAKRESRITFTVQSQSDFSTLTAAQVR
jgi:hypothetical protein